MARGEGLPPPRKGAADKRPAARAARPILWGWGPALGAAAAVVALTVGVPVLMAILRHPPEDHLDAGPPDAGAAPPVPKPAPTPSPAQHELGGKPGSKP